jgi:negative regulator of flagellin synthesis FlgM
MTINTIGTPDLAYTYNPALSAQAASSDLGQTNLTAGQTDRSSDQVAISDVARAFAVAREAVGAAPDVRADKVATIRQSLANGTYTVDPGALARSLLSQTQSK